VTLSKKRFMISSIYGSPRFMDEHQLNIEQVEGQHEY